MNDRLSKILLALVAVALWGILIRSFFDTPALQAKSPVSQALTASVVTARTFQLVDDKGKPCGSLSSDGDGAILSLGRSSNLRLYTSGSRAGYLDMFDAKGEHTVRLSAIESDYSVPNGGGHLLLWSDKDRTILSPGHIALTQGVSHVSAESGRVAVPVDAGSKPFIELDNQQVAPKSVGQ